MATKSIKNSNDNFIHFVSGGFGLATAFAIMHPLDTLKTQLQTKTFNIKGLSRGFYVSFLMAFPQGGLRLSTYEYMKRKILDGNYANYTLASALSACAGDTVSSIVKVPREVITQRLQSGVDSKVLNTQYSPTAQTVKLIVKEQGMQGLFRGFWSTTFRDWPFMVILFTTYESFKQNHLKRYNESSSMVDTKLPLNESKEIGKVSSTLFGGVSGALAGFFTAPADVIKTKIMTSSSSSDTSFRNISSNIYKNEGFRGFFVGAGARSVWWFCVCSMFFPIYEATKEVVGDVLQKNGSQLDDAMLKL